MRIGTLVLAIVLAGVGRADAWPSDLGHTEVWPSGPGHTDAWPSGPGHTQVWPSDLGHVAMWPSDGAQAIDAIVLRGHRQTLHLYGARGGEPVVVSSGDGGWMHLAPEVASLLAARGYFVVGFDVKAYLESFTTTTGTLQADNEPADYQQIVEYARGGSNRKPILIGVSEGAGLSVLAATDPATKRAIAGVIGLGLPDANELGWRWRDAIIYLTHAAPKEPSFSTAAIADRVAPLPLAAIHATHDEFVPLDEVQHVMNRAAEPKRLWVVNASNHRFSDNVGELTTKLVEAIAWVRQCQAS